MAFSLQNKVALITGAGSGIGKAIAEVFSSQGATACLVDVNPETKKVAETLASKGQAAEFFPCDVASSSAVEDTVAKIIKAFTKLDILVNSAGIAHVGNLESTSTEDFNRVFDVNVKGTFQVMKSCVTRMKDQKKGVILNLASIASSAGVADRFAYSMSKGSVVGMTLSVARDYLHDGIRCNCISPARVHTSFVDGFLKANYPGREEEMFEKLSKAQPLGRMARPEEIAYLALYLCSDEAAFVTGCDYPIDGGFLNLHS